MMRIYIVQYEWHERKNRENQRKHRGISFQLATLIFEDESCLTFMDRLDAHGEQRWHAIGAVCIEPGARAVLLVVHAIREDHHGKEIIRIISARKADKREVRRYQEQAMD